ncbi:hypothetical protein [Pseudonocardia humida]|uniref:Tn3 transposase DDE domain-containing protein n=1 Tax=Pseudonocardia humida TaxID=2800819 RepID=A0ABT1AAI9_9PSEU|nr:hypothetical protein [Pseudonocardia humida]MCO1659966.1 hypothetical protein [Pseudonocardia humida]
MDGSVTQEPDFTGLRAMYINCDFTNRNIAFMTHNLLHVASTVRRAGGFPAHGNLRTAWDTGSHPDNANPEYR